MIKYQTSAGCIFCKIITGEAPAKILYKDDGVTAFTPLEPVNSGHLLVIPTEHFQDISRIHDDVLNNTVSVLKLLSEQLLKDNTWTGVNILHASGQDAQQSVPHFHWHLVPRTVGDDLDLWIKQSL
jgi:histidine triad (HIT) family protein